MPINLSYNSVKEAVEEALKALKRVVVLLDADGVQWDAEHFSHIAEFQILKEENKKIPILFDELSEKLYGLKVAQHQNALETWFQEIGVEVSFPENFVEKLTIRQSELFKELDLKPVDGIVELLEFFQEKNIPYALVTRSRYEPMMEKMQKTGLDKFYNESNTFYTAMLENEGAKQVVAEYAEKHSISLNKIGEDKTSDFIYAAAKMGFYPEQCICVEDTPGGIKSICNANMTPICFIGAPSTKLELATKGLKEHYYLVDNLV